MTDTARTVNGRLRERWTEEDHADQFIVGTMVPLLDLAEAFPKMVELVGEHLLARFGHPEPPDLRVSDADVRCMWGNLVSFVTVMEDMLWSDRPEAMKGVVRLHRSYEKGTWGWPS
jgi:hypothetical protein